MHKVTHINLHLQGICAKKALYYKNISKSMSFFGYFCKDYSDTSIALTEYGGSVNVAPSSFGALAASNGFTALSAGLP